MLKLQKAGGFNTLKTAQNTWGGIKKKLASIAPPAEEAEDGDKDVGKSQAMHSHQLRIH
jgi:hypothetical protein